MLSPITNSITPSFLYILPKKTTKNLKNLIKKLDSYKKEGIKLEKLEESKPNKIKID